MLTLGVRLLSLGMALETELGDEFGSDFDEFDELGGHFLVCLRQKITEFGEFGGAELGGDFDEFDEFGVISLCVRKKQG